MAETWESQAREELARLGGDGMTWSYRKGSSPAVEPTVLAAMALDGSRKRGQPSRLGLEVANWLLGQQQSDGSLGVSADLGRPGWSTPYAILFWESLARFDDGRRRAVDWLLAEKGIPLSQDQSDRRVVGHDMSLVGWPWVGHTHSWLEPTALALLALAGEGQLDHPRGLEGIKLVEDRALPSGGWNYGNTIIYGRELRPQPAPTGLALLALANAGHSGPVVDSALEYLGITLPKVRSAMSLGWGLIGLRAWQALPEEAGEWLAESHRCTSGKADAAMGLALLLLASQPESISWFLLRNPEHRESTLNRTQP